MSKVYKNPGAAAFATFQEAADNVILNEKEPGWIMECNDPTKIILHGYFYCEGSQDTWEWFVNERGCTPCAVVEVNSEGQVEVHPRFTGVEYHAV